MTQDADKMTAMIKASFDCVFTLDHIRESNDIENIDHDPTDAEVWEWNRFMELSELTVEDIKRFVYVYAGAKVRLRTRAVDDDHHIGKRRLKGGAHVLAKLSALLQAINEDRIDVWHAHIEFELLHPFSDCNGRSGRMIWHWMMKKNYGTGYEAMTSIGFLRRFYYQSMQFNDSNIVDAS